MNGRSAGGRVWRALRLGLSRSGWAARSAAWLGQQRRLQVRPLAMALRTPTPVPPLRVAFASDFHAGPSTHPALLQRTIETLRNLAPDLVLLGGDFVCQHAYDIRPLARWLATLQPPLGTFAVLGNHDHWTDPAYVVRALTRAGVTMLTNRQHPLPAPWTGIHLCGLDDPVAGRPDPEAAFNGADGARLVLMHAPAGLAAIGDTRFDLALCGHTHGGQMALPGGIPLYLPHGHLDRRLAAGQFSLGAGRSLLVSRGVGYSTVPFRTFCDPEVHWLQLRSHPVPRASRSSGVRHSARDTDANQTTGPAGSLNRDSYDD